MREIVINLNLKFRIPEKDTTFNGLLWGLRKGLTEIMSSVAKALVTGIEDAVIESITKMHPVRYVSNGHQSKPRKLKTFFGLFEYSLAQLYDKVAKKTIVPLRESGFLTKYRQYTDEALEGSIGSVIHVSYRWSKKEVERLTGCAPTVGTIHRRLQEFAEGCCRWPDMRMIPYRFLLVDGTKVKLQEGGRDIGTKEMRWAMASLDEKEPFRLIGFWVDKDWAEIKRDLERRINYEGLEILLSDGAPGIEENLLEEWMRPQRCTLHGKRDFMYVLYSEGLKKKEQGPLIDKFNSIPVFGLNRERLEELEGDDLLKVKGLAEKTKEGFKEMLDVLDANKYPKARVYVENLLEGIMTFFSWWIEKRQWIPINTNAIESAISRVKNRIKRVGRRWSERGLINWLMVSLNKVFHPEMWEKLWEQYLRVNPEFKLVSVRASYRWI